MLWTLVVTFSILVFADSNQALPDYQAGLKAFQAGQFVEAQEKFQLAHDKAPDNALILYNLGVAAFKQNNVGLSAAAWRRAITIDPDLGLARSSLNYLTESGMLKSMTFSKTDGWEEFRQLVLNRFSVDQMLLLTLILFTCSGFLVIRYFGRRRWSLKNEEPLPPFPSVGLFFVGLFLIGATLLGLKSIDYLQPRATILTEKLEVKSGPNENDVTLFELFAGAEVLIQRKENDWVQITFPGGLTGWAPTKSIFQTSGRDLW